MAEQPLATTGGPADVNANEPALVQERPNPSSRGNGSSTERYTSMRYITAGDHFTPKGFALCVVGDFLTWPCFASIPKRGNLRC